MLIRIREWLIIVLVALLPFHALFVTVGTKLVAGPDHSSLSWLAVWKEGVLGAVLIAALLEITQRKRKLCMGETFLPHKFSFALSLRRGVAATEQFFRFDVLDLLIIGLFIASIAISYLHPAQSYVYGFKYDFFPLITFILLRRVQWSDWFKETIMKVLLCCGVIVAVYGIISFFLPLSFFTWLGYSPWHSLYSPAGPLAAFQQIGGTTIRRVQSTMSGPNQFGLWLLIPWSVVLVEIFRKKEVSGQWSVVSASALISLGILLSFSRAAWVAAGVMFVVVLAKSVSRKKFLMTIVGGMCIVVVGIVPFAVLRPAFLLRAASTRDHLRRPMEAVQVMIAHPFGLGLGSAGPASNLTSDACVHLNESDDASWAKERKDLCVFVGDTQVQPVDRTCRCPLLPENWYLQIGVELGWSGFILYLAMLLIVLRNLQSKISSSIVNCQLSIFLMFLGLSLAALFLHAFEDSAVAYTVWLLIASTAFHSSKQLDRAEVEE